MGTVSVDIYSDAYILQSSSNTINSDADILKSSSNTRNSNSKIKKAYSKTIISNGGIIESGTTRTHLHSDSKIKKASNLKTRNSNSYIKKRIAPTKNSNAKIKTSYRKSLTCGIYVRNVPPTRNTIGKEHRINGTITNVLGELNTAGINPLDIISYSESGGNAVCVYRRGN